MGMDVFRMGYLEPQHCVPESKSLQSFFDPQDDNAYILSYLACLLRDPNFTIHRYEAEFQLTFPEFHFETEAKVDFPSACI